MFLSSCRTGSHSGELLKGERLFTVDIGVLEDEIDLFHRGNIIPNSRNSLYMYQGLVFIANSLGGKIMEFSSYGDLLSLKYNEQSNPRPVQLSPIQEEDKIVNKTSVPFPFYEIGDIAVSSDHIMMVEDHVAPEGRLVDQDSGTLLQHIIHRFSPEGQHLDYIGQEGVGGTPFAFVDSIHITNNDELVVVTRDINDYQIFWYDREGDLRFNVRIDEDHMPAGQRPGDVPSVAGIFPDMNKSRLYIHFNFISDAHSHIDSRIYMLDLPQGLYSDYFILPENLQPINTPDGMGEIQYLYDFIGTAGDSYLYFLSRNNSVEQTLLIMNDQGRLVAKRIIRLENPDIFLTDFKVSKEGILTGLLGTPEGADVYWWRSDALIK